MKSETERMLQKASADYHEILKRVLGAHQLAMEVQLNGVPPATVQQLCAAENVTTVNTRLQLPGTQVSLLLSSSPADELPF